MKMDQRDIDELIGKFKASGLGVLEYEEDGFRFRVEKEPSVVFAGQPAAGAVSAAGSMAQSVQESAPSEAVSTAAPAAAPAAHKETIDSPIVGVFYQAPAPGEEPFVKEGDKVNAGDTVCVIEAMKVMNEIRASFDCRITKILAADGGMVEFGSPLFEVEKC